MSFEQAVGLSKPASYDQNFENCSHKWRCCNSSALGWTDASISVGQEQHCLRELVSVFEVILAKTYKFKEQIQKITASWGSISTQDSENFSVLSFDAHRNCEEGPGIAGCWGLFCMREGGSSPYWEVTQVLFVENGNSWKLASFPQVWKLQKRKKQKSTNLRLSDVIWLCYCSHVDSIPDIPIFEFIWARAFPANPLVVHRHPRYSNMLK